MALRRVGLLAISFVLVLPNFSAATDPGVEFRVNSYTAANQRLPSTAMASDGQFAVAWMSGGEDGDEFGVFGQRYDASADPAGTEFQINSYTTSDQYNPSVGMGSDGQFVVAWQSSEQDGYYTGVFAQLYNSSGSAVGDEFQVNTYTTADQNYPAAAMAPDGAFVIVWTSWGQDPDASAGVYAQRYNASGVAQGGEFRVNTTISDQQSDPSVTMGSDGRFLVVWDSFNQDGDGFGVYGQRYDASGVAQGSEFQVNTYTVGHQEYPSAAYDINHNFIIVWQSNGQDGDGAGIYAQRYGAGGAPVEGEFRVNTYTTAWQAHPRIAMTNDGWSVVTWMSDMQDGDGNGIYAQRLDAAADPLGDEFLVNTTTSNVQDFPYVTTDLGHHFLIVWESMGQDGDNWGVFAKLFDCFVDSNCESDQCDDGVCFSTTTTTVVTTTTTTTTTGGADDDTGDDTAIDDDASDDSAADDTADDASDDADDDSGADDVSDDSASATDDDNGGDDDGGCCG